MRIGIDLGGTKIEVAVLDADDQIVLRERVATPRHDYHAICDAIARLVLDAERELGARATVGVAIPGAVSPTTGLVKNANTVCLIGNPLEADLGRRLARPVRLENDANCFVVSEAADGAAAAASSVFGVIIGTGCGGGLYLNGAAIRGANGIAGEWGHNPAPWPRSSARARPCYCGRTDCIETYLSGPGLTFTYNEIGPAQCTTAEEIAAAAARGEVQARRAFETHLEQLAFALGTIVNVFDPQVVVLGGGLSNLPDIAAEVARRLPPYVFGPQFESQVVVAKHGDSSGVRGAAWLWSKAEAQAQASRHGD
jgi:fructokinase